jgi:hypothetical protein
LVVIGILIALNINNWNEKRKKNNSFNAIIEQIYNVLDQESQTMQNTKNHLQNQINIIDSILENPNTIEKEMLPNLMYYVETNPVKIESAAAYQLSFLWFDPKNNTQSKLSKSLSYYVNNNKIDFSENELQTVSTLLHNLNLPKPDLTFGYSAIDNYAAMDSNFFTEEQQDIVLKSISSESFQNALKSLRSQKNSFIFNIDNFMEEAKVNLNLIKSYYPKVKLFYTEVGIVGDATGKGWETTLLMKLTDQKLSIWEGDFELIDGGLKFRCGNTWTDNWGGYKFPEGDAIFFARNIPVKAGKYHVILNLTEKKYQFKKQ